MQHYRIQDVRNFCTEKFPKNIEIDSISLMLDSIQFRVFHRVGNSLQIYSTLCSGCSLASIWNIPLQRQADFKVKGSFQQQNLKYA